MVPDVTVQKLLLNRCITDVLLPIVDYLLRKKGCWLLLCSADKFGYLLLCERMFLGVDGVGVIGCGPCGD